jgi:uncharacterized damage-inducible protein DinB
MNTSNEFIGQSIYRFKLNLPRIEKCLDELSEEEIWQRPNRSSNAIGNLILHLCGNITQYVISGLGKQADNRDRESEFSARGSLGKKELKEKITETVNNAIKVFEELSEKDLLETKSLQGFEMSGVANILHVVEHLSYHTGQITFWTKCLKDKDLGFYSGMDLNARNR